MRLNAVRVFVDDLAAARKFYRDILGLQIAWEHPGTAIGFDLGLNLIVETVGEDADAEDRALIGRFVGCSLEVDNIDAIYKKLCANGVEFTGPPEKQNWGGTLAHFKDPNGNILTLLET